MCLSVHSLHGSNNIAIVLCLSLRASVRNNKYDVLRQEVSLPRLIESRLLTVITDSRYFVHTIQLSERFTRDVGKRIS